MVAFVAPNVGLATRLGEFLRFTQHTIPFDRGTVLMVEPPTLETRAVYLAVQPPLHPSDRERGSALTRHLASKVAETGEVFLAPALAREHVGEFADLSEGDRAIQSFLGVPIWDAKVVIGVLAMESRKPYCFQDSHVALALIAAEQIGMSLAYERLVIEQERRTAHSQLEVETSSSLHAILQSMTDGVLAEDMAGNITYINNPLFALMGLTRDERWIGRKATDLWHHFQQRAPSLPNLATARTQRKVRAGFFVRQGDVANQCEVELHYQPIADQQGGEVGRLLLVRDVTQTRANERTKDELISVLSHELRTPLTSILGYSKLLVDRPDATVERRARWAELILDKSRLLSQLVNEVLDLSRVNMQRLDLRMEPTDLVQLASRIADELRVTTTRHTIAVEAEPNLPLVTLDRHRMDQMLTNLVTNAIKYSPDGGLVTVRIARDGRFVILSVADNGVGIADSHHERIFEPFFRVDHSTTRNVYGTGLGLSLVRGIAEAHGGDVTLKSSPGQGSTFSVRLPLTDIESDS